MKNIEVDFERARGKSILFLGKFHSLTPQELRDFLAQFDIAYTDVLGETVTMFVEGTIMSPLEEAIASAAFAQSIPAYKTDDFENLYAKSVRAESLIMSLKLSNDQKRLGRLLQNHHFDNALFLKLFALYDWGDEGMFDNSANMEVAVLFAKRFFYKDRFDPATYYSPISIFEIALSSERPDVLETLYHVPDIKVKQSRSCAKRPTTIKEALATNTYLNSQTLTRLLRLKDHEIDYFLAQNPSLDHQSLLTLLHRADDEVKSALACNKNLPDSAFLALLEADETTLSHLQTYQFIDETRFLQLKNLHEGIGENENLSPWVITRLIEQNDPHIISSLAANASLNPSDLEKIYVLGVSAYDAPLASNPRLALTLLEALYAKNDEEISHSLAANPATPLHILDALYAKNDFELNCFLSLNPSLPLKYLNQLKLDTRLLNYLKENKTFTENILQNLGI